LPESIEIERDLIPENAETSMNSTFRGISIDDNDDNLKADSSIRFNDDGDSNEIDSNDSQNAKQPDSRIST
jgi:hypothetical protein